MLPKSKIQKFLEDEREREELPRHPRNLNLPPLPHDSELQKFLDVYARVDEESPDEEPSAWDVDILKKCLDLQKQVTEQFNLMNKLTDRLINAEREVVKTQKFTLELQDYIEELTLKLTGDLREEN